MFSTGSPNQGQLQIGIALVLQDRFSNQAREASSQIRRLHNDAKVVTNANLNAVKSLSQMGLAAGTAASLGLANVIQRGATFVDTMTFVDAIATKNTITMAQLSEKARTLGRDTMFGSQDIASAMQYMAMAGMDTKEIWANIEATANLAGGTMTALGGKGGAADIMTNIMKMFRIASTEINSTRVADILTKGVTSANTNLYDLAEAIKYAGTTVTNLGASLEQTTAFIGVLGNAGIQGSMAGTAMANTYRYLTKSIEDTRFKGNKALKALGLSREDFVDANGNLIDMGLAMQKIAKATSGLSDTQKFNTLVSILGVRGERGGSTMVRAFEDYSKLLNKLQNESGGTAAEVMAKRMESIAGGINKMTSALENIQTTFTESVAPALTPIFNGIAYVFELVGKFFNIPILGTAVSSLLVFGTALFTVRMGLIALKSSWRLMFNDSTVTFANMIAVMKAGWKSASIDAAQYQAIEAGIIAQRKAGIVSSAVGAGTFAANAGLNYIVNNPGTRAGGIFYKNGRFYQETGRGATGVTRISSAAAATALSGKTHQQLGIVAANIPKTTLSAGMFSGGVKGFGKGILNVLKAGVGILGGPWGLAIAGGMFVLPLILDALRGNKESVDNNTDTINKDINDRNSNKNNIFGQKGLTDEEQRLMLVNALNNLDQTLKNKPVANLRIYVDGKETINKTIQDNQEEDIVNLGAK